MEKEKMIAEIVAFLDAHKESTASIAIASRILGHSNSHELDKEAIMELKNRLAEVDEDELETCYYIIS